MTMMPNNKFAMIAAKSQSASIVGERLRYDKGGFYIGKGVAESLLLGTRLQVLDIAALWVKWSSNKIVETRAELPLPKRDALDEIQWKGTRDDPWQNTRYMLLVETETGRVFTFQSSSGGGRKNVDGLSGQIARKQEERAGAMPVIELQSGHLHSPEHGPVPTPKFTVVDWVDSPEGPCLTLPSTPPALPLAQPGNGAATPTSRNLDDEIPF